MFPNAGGTWDNNAYPPDTSTPFPKDPRTAARAPLPNNNQTYEAGTGWTQGWSQPAQWPYPPTAPVPFQNWIPNVAPQPGVNCPPIGVPLPGIPPPGADWNKYTGISDNSGSAEKKSTEQGTHAVNGLPEGTSDLSLFLSNYCNSNKTNRHLVTVPVSPAKEVQDVAEAKGCATSGPAVTIPLESTSSEAANGMPIEKLVHASRKPNGDLPVESSIKPIPVEGESLLHKGDPGISMKRKVVLVEQTDNISSSGGKRLLIETLSFAPRLEGNGALFEKLESAPSTGKKEGPLEPWDNDTKSANSGASQLKPGGSTSTWAAMCRDRGLTLGNERIVTIKENRTSPGKPERTASSCEKQTSLGKWEQRFNISNSSRERGASLEKLERQVGSRENEASLPKSDRTFSSKEIRPSMGNHDWAAHGMEKVTSLEKADSSLIVRGSREPYTPESPGTDVRIDNPFLRISETEAGEPYDSHQILGNIRAQEASNMSAHAAAEKTPDPRTAAILAKKEEIEREYEQNCKTFFLAAAMMLEQEPSIQHTMVSALKKTLREIGKNGVKELENFIQRYDE